MGMATSSYRAPSFTTSRRGDDPTQGCLPKGKGNCSGCGKLFQLKAGKIPKHSNKYGRKCWTISPYNNETSLPVK